MSSINPTTTTISLMSKFRGCMIGGLIGDCLGSPFEGETSIPIDSIQKFLTKQLEEQSEKSPGFQILSYTDDTAMTKSIAQSLIEMKKFDPKDIAKRFALEYNKEPKRGYGTNVVDVFAALMLTNYESPYEPAKRQFGGFGSYGNGGAMRVGPCAMYGYNMELNKLLEFTRDCARITHSNIYGYNGAILQCLAIHQALHLHSIIRTITDINHYLNNLIEKMLRIELDSQTAYTMMMNQQNQQNHLTIISNNNHHLNSTATTNNTNDNNNQQQQINNQEKKLLTPFSDKLKKVKEILNNELKGNVRYSIDKIINGLGNDVSAFKSVPTAIYFALKGQISNRLLDSFDHQSPIVRTLYYSLMIGGDTDTIGSMACSISGALNGIESIPKILLKHCESSDIMEKYADDLFRLVRSTNSPPSSSSTTSTN
ncbi:ADP-ribosylhydrolase ARH3-like [Dermatophagoides pteronyssinus]|uniref:ADP-ribosylhydrolase ARH3-like n=1 Tax=Dermatophagoides pteronyssinus TaxID=6956 RepID=UPI003F678394